MRLPDQACAVARLLEILSDTMSILKQLRSKRPCAMLAWILPCNDGGSTWGTGRIRTVGSAERRPFSRKTVKIRGLDLRKKSPYRIPMLLIARNQKNIRSFLTHSRYTPIHWLWFRLSITLDIVKKELPHKNLLMSAALPFKQIVLKQSYSFTQDTSPSG